MIMLFFAGHRKVKYILLKWVLPENHLNVNRKANPQWIPFEAFFIISRLFIDFQAKIEPF